MSDATPVGRHRPDPRRRWFIILGGRDPGLRAGPMRSIISSTAIYFQSTDDAYVGGDIVVITSREPGTILALHADNTQVVRRGQLLVELDPVKARVCAGGGGSRSGADGTRRAHEFLQGRTNTAPSLPRRGSRWGKRQSDYRRRVSAGAPPCRTKNSCMPATR